MITQTGSDNWELSDLGYSLKVKQSECQENEWLTASHIISFSLSLSV